MNQTVNNRSLSIISKLGAVSLIMIICVALFTDERALAMQGGTYQLSRSTIDCGGGTSAGGAYVLVGTIAQPDAGQMAGGDYELLGGFWPGGPGAPLLCLVNFEHFAEIAMYWLNSPCNEGNNWCGGADLDFLGDVDLEDVKVLAYYWLSACPTDWPWE